MWGGENRWKVSEIESQLAQVNTYFGKTNRDHITAVGGKCEHVNLAGGGVNPNSSHLCNVFPVILFLCNSSSTSTFALNLKK